MTTGRINQVTSLPRAINCTKQTRGAEAPAPTGVSFAGRLFFKNICLTFARGLYGRQARAKANTLSPGSTHSNELPPVCSQHKAGPLMRRLHRTLALFKRRDLADLQIVNCVRFRHRPVGSHPSSSQGAVQCALPDLIVTHRRQIQTSIRLCKFPLPWQTSPTLEPQ